MKKSTLIAIIIIFVLIGGGVVWYVKNQKHEPVNPLATENGQVATTTEPVASFYSDIETKDWKVCKNEILGIQLKFPSTWGACKTDISSFSIKTEYKPYDVYLIANVGKNIKEDIDYYIVNREGGNYIKIKDGEIFDSFCAPAIACNGAILNSDLYFFSWDIKSNQSAPLGYDGIWSPDNNVTEEDTWKILSTIEKVE